MNSTGLTRIKLSKLKSNPNNPRIIKDDKFRKLVQSIQAFPEMLEARPIVCDPDGVVLGGNMRLKACLEAGLKEVPAYVVSWEEAKQKEFIIKDNVGYGEWDWDILANEWEPELLTEWGLDVWTPNVTDDLNEFFEHDSSREEDPEKYKIILEFSQEDGPLIKEKLLTVASTPEQALWKLLGI